MSGLVWSTWRIHYSCINVTWKERRDLKSSHWLKGFWRSNGCSERIPAGAGKLFQGCLREGNQSRDLEKLRKLMRRNGCYCDERQRQRKSRPVEEKLMQSLPQAMRENSSTLIGCFYKAPPVTSTQHALGSMEAECTRFTDEIYPHREIIALLFSVFAKLVK